MNTRIIKLPDIPKVHPVFIPRLRGIQPEILMIILLFIWLFGPIILRSLDRAAGNIDQSIWLLVVLSLISFLLILSICWRLLQHYYLKRGQSWCTTYVGWVYAPMGYGKPQSGWCPDLFPASRLARSALTGMLCRPIIISGSGQKEILLFRLPVVFPEKLIVFNSKEN